MRHSIPTRYPLAWVSVLALVACAACMQDVNFPGQSGDSGPHGGLDACVAKTCQQLGAQCGDLPDGCGRTLHCGDCDWPKTCGAGGVDNVCGCVSESQASFCQRHHKDCGQFTGADNCDLSRTVDCGACTSPRSCAGSGTPNVCGVSGCTPETDAALCQAAKKNCDAPKLVDNCQQTRWPSCGSCTPPDTCGGGGSPNVCGTGCVSESDAAFCTRLGKDCDSVTDLDDCGQSRTADCGTCPINQQCGAKVPNVCGSTTCVPETDPTFCGQYGKDCDSYQNIDNCGSPRTAACGTCPSGKNCGAQTANVCGTPGCVGETDAAFCARLGKDCDLTSGQDNCSQPRSADCGSCKSPLTCGGAGEVNVCGCDETVEDLCLQNGISCGPLTATDKCGKSRNVSCGSCTLPETCGGTGTTGVCGCTPETDGAFCKSLSLACGPASGTDNCGKPRSVASCGACGAGKACTTGACKCSSTSCPTHAHCDSSTGSCACDPGYSGDGITCSQATGDSCASVIALSFSGSVATASGSTVGLVNDTQVATCVDYYNVGASAPDVVYSFTTSATHTVVAKVSTSTTTFKPVVFLRSTCDADSSQLVCAHACTAPGTSVTASTSAAAGTYYVWIDGCQGTSGNYSLEIDLQ
jgi:hypothetical protein